MTCNTIDSQPYYPRYGSKSINVRTGSIPFPTQFLTFRRLLVVAGYQSPFPKSHPPNHILSSPDPMASRKRARDSDTETEAARKKTRRGGRTAPKASKASRSSKRAGKAKDVSTESSQSRSQSPSHANSPAQDSSLEEEIRCFCGSSFDDGNTVFCESCRAWQHIGCYYPDFLIPQVHTCVDCSGEDEDEDDDDDDDDDDVVSVGRSAPQKKIGPLVPARKFAVKSKPRKKTPGASAAVVGPSVKGNDKEKAGPAEESEDDDALKAMWFSVNVDLDEVLGEPRTEREERLHEVVRELVLGNHNLAEQIASLGSAMLRWKKRFELVLAGLLEDDEV